MILIIRSGITIQADHPRLYWNVHCTPGTEWFRFNIDVPKTYYATKDDSVTLPGWLGLPGIRHSCGIARWWHFSCALFWALNGVAFVVLLFATEQWQRLVPRTLEVIPNAVSTAIQYCSLRLPHENGWVRYGPSVAKPVMWPSTG
jgi:methionine sulfoxide reductase catalytic subunit